MLLFKLVPSVHKRWVIKYELNREIVMEAAQASSV